MIANDATPGSVLLWWATLPWAPTDWTLAPAWAAWLADVRARRRSPSTWDALSEAAYFEAEACLEIHQGREHQARVCLHWAEQAITDGHTVLTDPKAAA